MKEIVFVNGKTARKRMNILGGARRPFLFFIDYTMENIYIEQIEDIDQKKILFDLNGFSNILREEENPFRADQFYWQTSPPSFDVYLRSFNIVKEHLRYGNSFLTNLTGRTLVDTNLSLKELFYLTSARYKLWVKDYFTVFSPEPFIRIEKGKISSYPMKGTIDASIDNACECLQNNPKEMAEHATIVDLIRNDLSKIATEVRVLNYRYMEKIQTVNGDMWESSSEIQGSLLEGYESMLGDILFEMLPAGSITGAPKNKTIAIINEAEESNRGFYTGVCGYYDGEKLDSAVMIRFVEEAPDGHLYFHSGGGITFQSDPENEYKELILKTNVPFC